MKKHPPHPPKRELKETRVYSESFRKARVADIENGMLTVSETHRVYGISISVIYRWIHRYSKHLTHHTRQVVELESEQHRTKMLLERVSMLERTVGQKQLEIDVLRTCWIWLARNWETSGKKNTPRYPHMVSQQPVRTRVFDDCTLFLPRDYPASRIPSMGAPTEAGRSR